MKCPRCRKNKAIKDSHYGILPCLPCQQDEEHLIKPQLGHEFTTDSIRDERLEYRKDILQPWHNGVLSREFYEEYGTTGIEVTKKQVENARYTYKGVKGWWNRKKGKGGGKGRRSEKYGKYDK